MGLLQPHRARNRCTQTGFGMCHFASSMYLRCSLCSHYRLIKSLYKCVPFIDIFKEFVSIYLGLHSTTTVFQGELHSSIAMPSRPAGARICNKRGLGGRRTVTSLVTYHRTTSHPYTRVSHEDQECKSRMYVNLILITNTSL